MRCRNVRPLEAPSLAAAFVAALLAGAPLLGCQPASETQTGADAAGGVEDVTVVAGRIGDDEVLVGEVDDWIKDQLFKQSTRGLNPVKVYEVRSRAFEQMANERALDQEAQLHGKSRDELLREEVEKRASVTDEEVKAYYEENQRRFRNLPFEKAAPAVERQLLAQRQVKAMQEYTQSLRDGIGYESRLEPPRFEIAASELVLGPADAPITLVEFSDYECPYCKQAEKIVGEVIERYPTQLRLEFKHYPLANHPKARPAAEAALCAHEQGKFWEFHEQVFQRAPNIDAEQLGFVADAVQLDRPAYDACVAERRTQAAVDADVEAATKAGVSGTPSFFVNGVPVTGGRSLGEFAKAIDAELERLGLPVPPPPPAREQAAHPVVPPAPAAEPPAAAARPDAAAKPEAAAAPEAAKPAAEVAPEP